MQKSIAHMSIQGGRGHLFYKQQPTSSTGGVHAVSKLLLPYDHVSRGKDLLSACLHEQKDLFFMYIHIYFFYALCDP